MIRGVAAGAGTNLISSTCFTNHRWTRYRQTNSLYPPDTLPKVILAESDKLLFILLIPSLIPFQRRQPRKHAGVFDNILIDPILNVERRRTNDV